MKNGKIYDGNSIELIGGSLKDAFGEMSQKHNIADADTIASGGMYLEQQLREVLPEVLGQLYPEMPILNFLSVDNSGAMAQSIIQRAQSWTGEHKANHEIGDTKGVINVNRTAREQPIVNYNAESAYNDLDLRRSILLADNIDTALIEGHTLSYMTWIDKIGFEGITLPNSATPITSGLANFTQPDAALVRTSAATFEASTGLAIYQEIQGLYNVMVGKAGNNQALIPTVIVLPVKQYSIVSTELMTGTSPVTGFTTVREFIESKLQVKLYASNRLIGKGTTSTDRMVMLNNDRRNIRFHIPTPLRFAPVFIKGFNYLLESEFRIGGVGFNRSNAIGYLDGI